ncbi:alpha/beta hydrolase [Amycolatopsis sp. NPDC051373]|uniref:alpha/beta fold hydrolase n=1 Tax=Amycolatopsis sp. NPDC051373 TaxID=3155801 RepID=UPI0034503DDA
MTETAQVFHYPGRDGAVLACRSLGEGRPLVLLHGFTATGSQWLNQGPAASLAARGHRVLVPGLRGHGASAHPTTPAAYPPDVLTDDIFALLDTLSLTDYDLGGYSLGARIVVRLLARGARPGRAIVAAQGLSVITRTEAGDQSRHILTALANGEPLEPGTPDARAARWITALANDPQALLRVLDTHVPTPAADLPHIPTPTLVTAGADDPRRASAEDLAAVLPHAEFTLVPGNHITALGTPEFAAALTSFLARPIA